MKICHILSVKILMIRFNLNMPLINFNTLLYKKNVANVSILKLS